MPNKQNQGQTSAKRKVGNFSTVLLLTPLEIDRKAVSGREWFSRSPASAGFDQVEHPAAGVRRAAGGLRVKEPQILLSHGKSVSVSYHTNTNLKGLYEQRGIEVSINLACCLKIQGCLTLSAKITSPPQHHRAVTLSSHNTSHDCSGSITVSHQGLRKWIQEFSR